MFYLFGKELISGLSRAHVRAFHEKRDKVYTELTIITLKEQSFCRSSLICSTLFAPILMSTNKQTLSDVIILLAF